MDIKTLNRSIQNNEFSNLYFFYGEEDYLKELYIHRIIHAVVDDAFSCFNLFHYQEAPAIEELRNAIEQPPVMAKYKVVYLNQLDLDKNGALRNAVTAKIEDLPDFCILIIRETAVDKRSKLWSALQKLGASVECVYPSPGDVRAFIQREFQARKKKISTALADRIVQESEPSLYAVVNLIDEVCAYLQDVDTVNDQTLNQFLQKSVQAVIFDLSERLVNHQKESAYHLLNQLKLHPSKHPPQALFSLLARHITNLYLVTAAQKEGIGAEKIKHLLGKKVPDFVVQKYLRQAKNISQNKLEELISYCADTDYRLKSGQIADPYTGIYTLFLKFWEPQQNDSPNKKGSLI